MRLRLWQRLFAFNALLIVVAFAALVLIWQVGFRRGLLDYVNDFEQARMREVAQRLAEGYAREGDWRFVRRDPARIMRLISQTMAEGARPVLAPPGETNRPDAPPFAEDQGPPLDGEPDPRADRAEGDGPPRFRPFPPPGQRRPLGAGAQGPPPDARDPMRHSVQNIGPRLLLLDASGTPVIGNALLDRLSPSTPIMVEGQAVGAILLAPRPALSDAADLEFAKAQVRAMSWIALGVLALALPLSLWLARQMTKPLRALAQGARKLAAGELATRVAAARGDEVGDLTVDFNRLAETLERHRDLRRDWVADISHELRTPLSVLRGEIHALEDGVRPLDAAAVASLRVEADRLSALIEDLYQLSLSDLGALSYQFESIDLDRVLRDTLDAHQAAFAQQGLSAHVVTPRARDCLVRADERRLAQLFGNLLVNAARYTDRPGRVEIALANEGAHVVVHIDDTPPGVPTEALPRLFERFYRVESSRNRAAGGAGLGLAISRNIVEAHGGEITACASPLGGLRVSVRLPRATGPR